MAMAPTFHDDWPTTSVLPQESRHSLPAVATQSSVSRLSYAEIANGKHAIRPLKQMPSDFSGGHTQILNNGTPSNLPNSAILYVDAPPLIPTGATPSASSCSPRLNPPLNTTNSISPIIPTSASLQRTGVSPCQEVNGHVNGGVADSWQTAVEDLERDNVIREKIGLIVNQRYRILQKISFGSYGSIYSAVDLLTNRDVAVKFEIGAKQNTDLHLKYENDVYHAIKGAPGVPAIHWFGTEYDHQILVMQLLGPSLEQLFSFCERHFSSDTIISLGEQMVQRIRNLHSRGFLHRDIKPENFLMGLGEEENVCFLVDFGLARRYRFRDGDGTLRHIPFRKGKNLVGTAKYASLNSHNGLELSRRDDLESLGYIIVEFINRELPWKEQRSKARFRTKQQSYNRIRNIKEQTDWSTLCPRMAEWIRYCRQLEFPDDPDYDHLISILRSLKPSEESVMEEAASNGIQEQTVEGGCSSSSTANVAPCQASHIRDVSRPTASFAAMNGCQNTGEHKRWMPRAGHISLPSPRISNSRSQQMVGTYGHPVHWPPSTTTPPPRFLPAAQYRAFNPGFVYPPPSFHRFPVDLQRTHFPSTHSGSDSGRSQIHQQHRMRSFQRSSTRNADSDISSEEAAKRRFDDGTMRYSWLMRRDSSPNQRYAFDCLFRWTLPSGCEPVIPPSRSNGSSFGFGGVRNPFQQHSARNQARAK
uniref:non-specific serine/threonine protein kinase n=1 Tax=Parascaris univalens TaxID=6257 RepID=A0A915BAQ2_PARUN